MIDFSLSEQQKAFQKTARDFAQKEIAPVALDYDKNPRFPGDIIQKAHAAGLMNLTCPKEYGGQGLGLVDSSIITEELTVGLRGHFRHDRDQFPGLRTHRGRRLP